MITPRLAIDLSGPMIRILVGTPGGPMRCAEAPAPVGALRGGAVEDSGAVAKVLRQLVARAEVRETRAMIAANDSLASFRVLSIAKDLSEPKIESLVEAQLPADGGRMGRKRIEVATNGDERTIYALAFDRPKVQSLAATVRLAGLEPTAIELKSLCVARSVNEPACLVLDLGSDPAEILLIDGNLPRIWHSFKVDLESPDNVIEKSVSALRSVLSFFKRQQGGGDFSADAPIFINPEQSLSSSAVAALENQIGHSVLALPAPHRVDPEIRHASFLACIGLIMRRR
jgi:hypothetical protein